MTTATTITREQPGRACLITETPQYTAILKHQGTTMLYKVCDVFPCRGRLHLRKCDSRGRLLGKGHRYVPITELAQRGYTLYQDGISWGNVVTYILLGACAVGFYMGAWVVGELMGWWG